MNSAFARLSNEEKEEKQMNLSSGINSRRGNDNGYGECTMYIFLIMTMCFICEHVYVLESEERMKTSI